MKNWTKKVFILYIIIVMAVVVCPISANAVKYETGDIIEFGYYPQTEVKSEELIEKLNEIEGTWKSYGYLSGSGSSMLTYVLSNDGSAQPSDYMEYKDVFYGNIKYRAVTFSTYRPIHINDESIDYHSISYQAGNGYSTNKIYWFKFEPLKWRVLDPDNGLILCESVIDSQSFSNSCIQYGEVVIGGIYHYSASWKDFEHTIHVNNYAESSIRQWLNDDFYNTAFNDRQKDEIGITPVENKAYSETFSVFDSKTTNDKVFLLSLEDVKKNNYGFSTENQEDPSRSALGTDYAKCQGLGVSGFYSAGWLLRTAGQPGSVCCVATNGVAGSYNFSAYSTSGGIRPAMVVDLEYANPYNLGEETYSFENYIDDDSDGGHCFGMSSTSSFYYLGLLNFPSQTLNTYSLPYNSVTRKPICTYMAIQGSYRDKAMVAGGHYYKFHIFKQYDIKSDWNEVVNYVKDHSHDGKGDLQIGFRKEGEGGHAINFLRYENIDGQDRIYAYDNNEPNRETYFYKAEDGNVYQAVYSTFSGSIDCITLRDMNKYFENAKKYQKKNAVYSSSDAIKIDNAMYSPMDMDSSEVEYYMFELPDDINEIEIVPLKDNAEFRYMDEIYTFGEITENTVGILKLAESDDGEAAATVEFNVIEDITDEPDISKDCSCNCHKSGISNIFWKIINFFHKIFKMEKYHYCDCGKDHWA